MQRAINNVATRIEDGNNKSGNTMGRDGHFLEDCKNVNK